MSGSTIGGVVGGVIGWFVGGGPQGAYWGWMIGSAAGAILMPEQFEGPRLNEAKTQTANDGVPLIYGYGTFPCAGNLTWVDEVKEHRKKESAKGGPETITYTYTVSYMIVVCKGEISGYKLIKRNGKIVYDARTDAELSALGYSANEISETRAAQASFLQRATLYYGTQTQMPDPTMVAVKGVGEVPAYTGIAYIVLKDDETREGEVSQYEFVVANCGDRTEDASLPQSLLVTGSKASGSTGPFASAKLTDSPVFVPIAEATGADLGGASPGFHNGTWIAVEKSGVRYSTDNMASWQTGTLTSSEALGPVWGLGTGWLAIIQNRYVASVFSASPIPIGFTHETGLVSYLSNGSAGDAGASPVMFVCGNEFFLARQSQRAVYRSTTPSGPYYALWDYLKEIAAGRDPNGACITSWFDIKPFQGMYYAIIAWHSSEAFRRYQIIRSDDLEDWSLFDVVVDVPRSSVSDRPAQLCVEGGVLCAYTTGSRLWTSANNWAESIGLGLTSVGGEVGVDSAIQGGNRIVGANGLFYCIDRSSMVVFNPITLGVSGLIPLAIINANGIALSGLVNDRYEPIPDAPGFFIDRVTGDITGPSGTQIDVCRPTLGSIVADQCERRGVTSRDVSELTDDVAGYRVAAPSTPQRNIQGLQPGYFFSASEFDGTLHFPKRGRALTFALTHDDFVERDGDPIQWERTQEAELLRKVTVGYLDPDTTYTATTQQAERRAATISADGESTIELAVTGSKDWAAQVADKSIKVAWGEPDECTFHVTIDHAELVVGAEGAVPYVDGTDTVIRIDRIEDEGLVRMVTGRRTRANLYESNASGAAKPLPRFPGSDIRGPTDGLLLNIPVLVDSNDIPGIHWVAAGVTGGWAGAQLQILRAGQWLVAGEATGAAAGTLLSELPAHAGDFDTANVLHVRFNDTLESVSYVNLLQERNPLAILRADGTAEIVQFQTATEVAAGEYELTGLLRGRLATESCTHASGARAVFLDERVQYATLEPTDVGQEVSYRFVSLGTDPDAAPIQTITLATMESQREWPVYDLQVEQDGDDFTLTWRQRDRLGSDVLPIRSTHWAGYEVSYTHPGGSDSVTVTAESHTFTIPGASDITFSVAQLNQFTGAGPAETVHIP